MKSLAERENDIKDFWGLKNESDRDNLIEEIRAYAESKPVEELASEIRANFEQQSLSGIGAIYDALSKNPEKWSEFFFEEYQRAFEAAEQSKNPFEILDSLGEISFADETKLPSRDKIIRLLEARLEHPMPTIRFKSIFLLGDWIGDDNKSFFSPLVQKIIACLNDENWRVRFVALQVLEDLKSLPKDFKLGIMDRLKFHFLNPFEMK